MIPLITFIKSRTLFMLGGVIYRKIDQSPSHGHYGSTQNAGGAVYPTSLGKEKRSAVEAPTNSAYKRNKFDHVQNTGILGKEMMTNLTMKRHHKGFGLTSQINTFKIYYGKSFKNFLYKSCNSTFGRILLISNIVMHDIDKFY